MKPFLLLQQRPEDAASDNEYEAFLKFSRLEPHQLRRERVESGSFPKINLNHYSGILLGGGPYTITDPLSKKTPQQKKFEVRLAELAKAVVEYDFPFLAACAIGIITKSQGGVVSRKYAEPIEPLLISLTAEGKRDNLTKNVPGEFWAFAGHKEACEALPDGAVLLAKSNSCPIELYRIKNNVYAAQFHPELDAESLALRINVYKNYGYFPPEEAHNLIEKVLASKVTEPLKILRNFVELYQQ